MNTTKQKLLVITVALGILLNPLNSSMIAVALSRIREDFELTFGELSWLVSTYYLASAIAQPVMGKLSDLFGRKRLFLLGLIMIVLASIAAPLSPNFGWLLFFRIIQSIGSSTLYPSGMGIIRSMITTNQARALSILSIFSSLSVAFGPSIGGFLMHYGDWPAIFLINFPIIIVSFSLAIKLLPSDPRIQFKSINIDIGGILLFSAMTMGWILFLLFLDNYAVWCFLALGVFFTVAFIKYESRVQEPFVDVVALKKNRTMSFIYLQNLLYNLIIYSILFGAPAYLLNTVNMNTRDTGLIMLSLGIFAIIVTPLASRWIDKSGSKPCLLAASAIILLGHLLILTIDSSSHPIWIFVVLSVIGSSSGFFNLGIQTSLYSLVSTEETGTASGLLKTSQYMGTILSSAILGLLFGKNITTSNFHMLALISAIIVIAIFTLTFRMKNKKEIKAISKS